MKRFYPIVLIAPIVLIVLIKATTPEPSHRRATPTFQSGLRPQASEQTTTLFFAGDIMLSRNVAIETAKTDDYAYPFGQVGEEIRAFNLSFANLESPFWDLGPYGQQGIIFKARPETVWGLTFAGFDVLSTANNHAYDQGKAGIEYTLKHLKENGIIPVGTGLDCHEGKVIEKNGIKFGFLAYSYAAFNDGGKKSDPMLCDWNDTPGVAADIKTIKPKSDFVIVSSHMGTEYKRKPDDQNAVLARKAIDAGADMFVGHHPHWIQTIEEYKDKWIFYSLGNFVFDQMWSQDTKEGLTITITFSARGGSASGGNDNKITKIELRPMVIENFCCPRWANDEETVSILKKINLTDKILLDKND